MKLVVQDFSNADSASFFFVLRFFSQLPTAAQKLTVHHRNTGPEGWRLRQRHFETVTSLVRSCRRFFPAGSASDIWSEFR